MRRFVLLLRFEDAFLEAREAVKTIGKVIKIELVADMRMNADSKWVKPLQSLSQIRPMDVGP